MKSYFYSRVRTFSSDGLFSLSRSWRTGVFWNCNYWPIGQVHTTEISQAIHPAVALVHSALCMARPPAVMS